MAIKVTKRNNTTIDYSPEKITKVVEAAGLSKEEAIDLTEAINKWLNERNDEKVASIQIRDRVIVEIQKRNESAAKKYIWFEKYKDKHFEE